MEVRDEDPAEGAAAEGATLAAEAAELDCTAEFGTFEIEPVWCAFTPPVAREIDAVALAATLAAAWNFSNLV